MHDDSGSETDCSKLPSRGREAGAGRAELWVTEGNSMAQSFYTHAGFRPTPETQPLRNGSPLTVNKLLTDL